MKNYYEILEVNPKASSEIIEKAYRVLVKKYHPDAYVGDKKIYAEQKIREINEAYHVLSEEFLREQYDREIEKESQFTQANQNIRNFNKQNNKGKAQKDFYPEQEERKSRQHKVGTLMAMIDVLKEVFRPRQKKRNLRELKKEDKIALGLTVIIVIVLGIILWFIPATNGFIRSLNPF